MTALKACFLSNHNHVIRVLSEPFLLRSMLLVKLHFLTDTQYDYVYLTSRVVQSFNVNTYGKVGPDPEVAFKFL